MVVNAKNTRQTIKIAGPAVPSTPGRPREKASIVTSTPSNPMFQAPEIDGVTYFQAAHAETGKRYRVKIDRTDAYDLYGTAEESL